MTFKRGHTGIIDSEMQDYIYSLPEDKRFPSLEKLIKAKTLGQMPKPGEAAQILAKSLEKALSKESGAFLDVREM